MEGLARYCTTAASPGADGLVGPAQVEWLNRVRNDLENYRAALSWLIARGRANDACDIAWSLRFFWVFRGHASEGLRWYEQVLMLPSLEPATESKALLGAGVMVFTQGELAHARTLVTRALALAARAGIARLPRTPRRSTATSNLPGATSTPHAAGSPEAWQGPVPWRWRRPRRMR